MRQGDRPLELHPYLGQRPDALLDLTLDMVSFLSGSPDRETLGNTLIHTSAHLPSLTHSWKPLHICSRIHMACPLAGFSTCLPQRKIHIHAFTCLLSV